MVDKNILDFRLQAEQMLDILENRLTASQREMALELLILKFKALFEQGIASGRIYEREGTFPFASLDETRR